MVRSARDRPDRCRRAGCPRGALGADGAGLAGDRGGRHPVPCPGVGRPRRARRWSSCTASRPALGGGGGSGPRSRPPATGWSRRICPATGSTGSWRGHAVLRDNAADLAAFARAAFEAAPGDVRIVGHSWGALTAAWFPGVGYPPRRLVLVDPPTIPLAVIVRLLESPDDRHYDDVATAMDAVGRQCPTWSYGDVAAKAESLTQFDEPAVLAILTGKRRLGRRPRGARRPGRAGRPDAPDPRRPGGRRLHPRRCRSGVRGPARRRERHDDHRGAPLAPPDAPH